MGARAHPKRSRLDVYKRQITHFEFYIIFIATIIIFRRMNTGFISDAFPVIGIICPAHKI